MRIPKYLIFKVKASLVQVELEPIELEKLLEAERPRGEWTDNRNGTYTCSECGFPHSMSNYCPHCGSDMRTKEGEVE